MRVGKCVAVGSLNYDTIDGPGDRLMTLATKYIFFFLGLRFFSFFLLDNRGLAIAPLFRRLAKKMKAARICRDHLKWPQSKPDEPELVRIFH
jgi:hypothetical protein